MNPACMCRSFVLLLLACLAESSRAADQLPSLNTAIWEASHEALQWLNDHGCRSAAVLQCQTWVGDQAPRHDLGPIHINVAERLERGLILVQRYKDPELRVARAAHRVAASTGGASFDTANGRQALCGAMFAPAWGDGKLQPDAFLIGMLRLESKSATEATLFLLAFTRSNPDEPPQRIAMVRASLAVQDMIDAGRRFTTRGLFDGGKTQVKLTDPDLPPNERLESIVAKASIDPGPQFNVAIPSAGAPVRLIVVINGQPQSMTERDGEWTVAEPREGQKFELIVERQGSAKPRLGVVLKVNGENTAHGKERLPDAQCVKWIMEPELGRFRIGEFQIDHEHIQKFRVASEAESNRVERQFGSDVGTISLTVFGERQAESDLQPFQIAQGTQPEPDKLHAKSSVKDDLKAICEGTIPLRPGEGEGNAVRPLQTRSQCQIALREGKSATRGLVMSDKQEIREVKQTEFKLDPIPLMSLTVRYRQARP